MWARNKSSAPAAPRTATFLFKALEEENALRSRSETNMSVSCDFGPSTRRVSVGLQGIRNETNLLPSILEADVEKALVNILDQSKLGGGVVDLGSENIQAGAMEAR